MTKHLYKYFLIFLLVPTSIYSQFFQKDYSTVYDSLPNEKDLYLHILGASFFNNNEFFNPYQPGYTLIGGFLQPKFIYAINPKLILSTGLHISKYYGDEGFAHAEPVFSINYKVSDAVSVLMGSYEGGQNHRLPETLYNFENHFTGLVENGIQISLYKEFLESEIWLDWEKFIESGDPFREEFMAGIVNRIKLFNSNEKVRFEIPLIILAHHAGGQINNNNQAVESVYNSVEGLKIYSPIISGIRTLSPYAELLFHQSNGDFLSGSGSAIQLTGGFAHKNIEINAGYFKGKDFMSVYGLKLYHSYTDNQPSGYNLGGTNEILSVKAGLKVKIAETSFLWLRLEGYYNPGIKKFDYTYGLHMQINELAKLFNK